VLDENNLWTCSQCSDKVQAKKATHLESLPSTLFLHVKRLSYDNATQQRKKILSPVYFPQILSGKSIKPDDAAEDYKLRAVLVHSGTASGGHYKAYIQSKGTWFEYDDSTVSELSKEDEQKLFWFSKPDDVNENAPDSSDFIMKGFSVYEGAYMLLYQRDSKTLADEENTAVSIPSELVDQVKSANDHLNQLKKAYEVHKLMTEVRCFKIVADMGSHVKANNIALPPTTSYIIGSKSLDDAKQIVYDSFVRSGVIDTSTTDMSMCRLRRYNPSSRVVGETFTNRESSSLASLGLSPLCSLALEVLSPGGTFADFNPKEVEVRLLEWKDNKLPTPDDEVADVFVTVAGEENATVGALRNKTAEVFSVSEADRVVLATMDSKSHYVELGDDSAILSTDCRVHSGDDVVVHILPDGQSRIGGRGEEVLKALEAQKRNIRISFNSLEEKQTEGDDIATVTYDRSLTTSLDNTLGDLKKIIASELGVSVDSFFLRRNANAPQLKKLNKTLDDLGFVDLSVIHVQAGRQVAPGEHVVVCEVDLVHDNTDWKVTPEKSSLTVGDFVVKERMTVAHLKEQLLAKWDELVGDQKSVVGTPQSVNHIRVRDGQTGVQSGPLRDNRILGRCLVGLADGRKIIIQVLPEAEVIGPDHLYISARLMSFQDKVISRPLSMLLPRGLTVQDLYKLLLEKYPSIGEEKSTPDPADPLHEVYSDFPECSIISVAKAYNSGPPLTMKSSLKLKWNDMSIVKEPTSAVDKPPFNLRDGSVLVVRNVADFERAREAARARVAERPSSAADSPMRGRLRPGSRARSRGGRREKAVTINPGTENIANGAAPPPPDPSPTKKEQGGIASVEGTGGVLRSPRMDINDGSTDAKNGLELPNAPVRVVKVLRSPRPGEEEAQL